MPALVLKHSILEVSANDFFLIILRDWIRALGSDLDCIALSAWSRALSAVNTLLEDRIRQRKLQSTLLADSLSQVSLQIHRW